MIWARPLSQDGDLQALPLLARSGLSSDERALVVSGIERIALVTGLDAEGRELLADTVGAGWLGGARDSAIVRFSKASLEQWAPRLDGNPELLRALQRLVHLTDPLPPMRVGPRTFAWGERTYVMGVLNVTPDSFSNDGQPTVEAAVAHARALVAAGADLLDIGGESTRPGSSGVDVQEELRRVLPVLEALARVLPEVPLSVDTSKPEVARAALLAGAHLINDVTGLRDAAMIEVLAERGAPAVVMHLKGTPSTMQAEASYGDVMAEVLDVLELALERAAAAGVPRARLLVDPGIGFAKTIEHNLFLLRHLNELRLLGAPVLVGTSRKAFLGALTHGRPPQERGVASAASVAVAAVLRGADLVRVHDVAQTTEALAVADAVSRAAGGGHHFGT